MSKVTTQEQLAAKTPEAAFLHVLREEFDFSPRVSRELLSTAQEMLVGGAPSSAVRPGQVRLVVASLSAPPCARSKLATKQKSRPVQVGRLFVLGFERRLRSWSQPTSLRDGCQGRAG